MKPDQDLPVPPDPEARLTAFLLGELSPQESADLQHALTQDPELAKLHDRLARTIGFLREAVAQPQSGVASQPELPKLSLARREALQAQFKTVKPRFLGMPSLKTLQDWVPWVAVAAAVVLTVAALPSFTAAKAKSKGMASPAEARPGIRAIRAGVDSAATLPLEPSVQKLDLQPGTESQRSWADYNNDGAPDSFITAQPSSLGSFFYAMTNHALPPEVAPASPAMGYAPSGQTVASGGMGGGDAAKVVSVVPHRSGPARPSRLNETDGIAPEQLRFRAKVEQTAPGVAEGEARSLMERVDESKVPVLGQAGNRLEAVAPSSGEKVALRRYGRVAASPSAKAADKLDAGVPVAGDVPTLGKLFRGAEVKDEASSAVAGRRFTSLELAQKPLAALAPAAAAPQGATAERYQEADREVVAGAFAATPVERELRRAESPAAAGYAFGVTVGDSAVEGKPAADFDAAVPNLAAKDLAPLPVQLPIPAFMGTPAETAGTREFDLWVKPASSATADASSLVELGEVNANGQVKIHLNAGRGELEQLGRDAKEKKVVEAIASNSPTPATLAKEEAVKLQDAPLEPPQALPLPQVQPEVNTAENRFSTFSLNVADVSFRLAAASLEQNQLPNPATIRSEEFINAFQYRDPEPAAGRPVAFAWERARYPFAHNRDLLRFSVRTAAQGRETGRSLNLVLVVDNSGSMERADRVATLREAFHVLAAQLLPADRVSVVTFSRVPRLWMDGVPGNQAGEQLDRLSSLTPEGGTNLEDALKAGYETALRHFNRQGVNRVILLTDGAANLGDVSAESLKRQVESNRKRGVATDCFGIGWEGYNDELLENLARNGDGRYGFVNTPEDAASGFANQLAGALQVAAADVKVQVEFNPQRVISWRQVGYAKHQLTKEQFRDNSVDAAELGAAEAGNAVYIVQLNPEGNGPVGIARVRHKVPATGVYEEQEWPMEYRTSAPAIEQASPTLRLAATASAFSELLANNPYAAEVTPDRLAAWMSGVPEAFAPDERPRMLLEMIRQYRNVRGQ